MYTDGYYGYSGRRIHCTVNVCGDAKIPLGCKVDVELHISWKVNLQTAYAYDEDLVSYKG